MEHSLLSKLQNPSQPRKAQVNRVGIRVQNAQADSGRNLRAKFAFPGFRPEKETTPVQATDPAVVASLSDKSTPLESVDPPPVPESSQLATASDEKKETPERSVGETPTLEKGSEPHAKSSTQDKKTSAAKPRQAADKVARRPENLVQIGETPILERFNRTKPEPIIKSAYYQNNREIFVNFINRVFAPFKKQLAKEAKDVSCGDPASTKFNLMTHQRVILTYLNQATPYRGVLVYHGLGSGKTCTSIAVAEGMKTSKKVVVMTPASLRRNYLEELKKCGDELYKKNQFWEQIKVTPKNAETLSFLLGIKMRSLVKRGKVWMVDSTKSPNYASLPSSDKRDVDIQLDEMIAAKYQFISYNGLRTDSFERLLQGPEGPINPFDSCVVVIDEAHNLVSRIVNKIAKPDSVSYRLYDLLLRANDCRIVMLSGTPIINYPNEVGIMFNMLRGYINTWSFTLQINAQRKVDIDYFKKILGSSTMGGNVRDYVTYSAVDSVLAITRNPFGFVNKTVKNKHAGVRLSEGGMMDDPAFVYNIERILKKNRIKVVGKPSVTRFKALPDTLQSFRELFINQDNTVKNTTLLKKRILGLSSSFQSPQEGLMPTYSVSKNFKVTEIPMSDFQFGVYEEARISERKLEKKANSKLAKKQPGVADIFEDSVSTYRIFSRAFCNFVFPRPDIKRPMPTSTGITDGTDEDVVDSGVVVESKDGKYSPEEVGTQATGVSRTYDSEIRAALKELYEGREKYLTRKGLETYSPKFLTVLENIESNPGKHLLYSQFRTLEGIEIFKLVLLTNGFAEFKVSNASGTWEIDIKKGDETKPKFVLYTGTESPEVKELLRNIYNGDTNALPPSIVSELGKDAKNLRGEIISIFMITASGAEGISLKNTRYVHLLEPYWHPVRLEQVIGRARRICSHHELPVAERTVDVWLYLMKFTDNQLETDASIELRLNDVSKKTGLPLTSDQALYEIATIKQRVNEVLLDSIKEAAIDCSLHRRAGKKGLKCYTFGTVDSDKFSYAGSYEDEEIDAVAEKNIKRVEVDAVDLEIKGVNYAYDPSTGAVYDYQSYVEKAPIQIGTLVTKANGDRALELV